MLQMIRCDEFDHKNFIEDFSKRYQVITTLLQTYKACKLSLKYLAYVEEFLVMNSNKIIKLGVFCGARSGNSPLYKEAAEQLANVMKELGISLVYGGAKVGLMGIIANQMLLKGGKVIGVMPKSLVDVEIAHEGLTELHVVNSMNERKVRFAELSDGFIMLPGGPGSLDEFFEMLTLAQLGYHPKPCGILNVSGYYDYLLKFLDHAVSQGFLKEIHRNMVIVDQSARELINRFISYQAPFDKKWTTEVASINRT